MGKTGKSILMFGAGLMVIVFMALGISMMPFSGDQTYGEGGCCMSRTCPDDSCTWYVTHGSYEDCKELNEQKDGDEVEEESGLIWWSSDC